MAPTKRNCKEVMSSPQRQPKKAKKDPLAEKLQKQLQEVSASLSQASTTKELEKMLEIVLPLSLGEFSDQRHKFQEQVVDGIAGLLGEVEASLKEAVAEKRSNRDKAATDKPQRDSEAAEAASKLEAKAAELHSLKVTLAGKAMAFREAKSGLEQAEEAKVVEGAKVRETEKKKGDFLVIVENLKVLTTVAPEEAEAQQKNKELMAMLRKHKFEESMMIALPAALAKAPDARGQFDLMALSQLEGEVAKLLGEQDAVLAAAAPGQAQCEAAIKAAEEKLAAARGEQKVAAQAYDVANKEREECESASNAAQKAVRDIANSIKKLDKLLNSAEVEVELFEQGPKETFKKLRERATPPPVVEAQPEEAMEAEAAAALPAVEEAPAAEPAMIAAA